MTREQLSDLKSLEDHVVQSALQVQRAQVEHENAKRCLDIMQHSLIRESEGK